MDADRGSQNDGGRKIFRLMNEYNEKETEIDLVELFHVLRSRVWAIILVTALAMGIAASYTMIFVTPMYASTSTIYVKGTATITSVQDLTMGTQMTQDYKVVITSRPVLDQVINDLGLNMSYTELRNQISINNPTDTRFLEITVTNSDDFMAKKIVDKLTDVSVDKMEAVMDTDKPSIMDYGHIPTGPSSPNLVKNTIIGGLLGFIVICGIIIVLHLMNDAIHTSEDIERYLGINTLGLIPLEEGTSKKKTRGRDAVHKVKKQFSRR